MNDDREQTKAVLNSAQRVRFEALVERLIQLGAPDPEGWALSEVTENIPQLMRFVFLKTLWPELINPYQSPEHWIKNKIASGERHPQEPFADAGAALKHLIEAGADLADIGEVARSVAYETVFGLLNMIDEGYSWEMEGSGPGWILMETDVNGRPTGRPLVGLHESFLALDPSGRNGRPA